MGIGAICELGRSDLEIAALSDAARRPLISATRHRIEEGKSKGEIGSGVDSQVAAEFVTATFADIKLAALSGASTANVARHRADVDAKPKILTIPEPTLTFGLFCP